MPSTLAVIVRYAIKNKILKIFEFRNEDYSKKLMRQKFFLVDSYKLFRFSYTKSRSLLRMDYVLVICEIF